MIKTELSTLTQSMTHYFYIIGVFLVIALQQKMEVAFTTMLTEIVQLFNESSVVRNAKALKMDIFHIQKLIQIT
ncbi:hypothetical protein TVAG_055860 [Trichomonas vaginalis G3]|uniref:Uncharacterized protein n=1 Tax=Trichomonas vaginalis (strain ATCC PRA-98 / G3) TaxID=412133 RepID=A2EL39_TRIV3|nr:hypothetical protein TVAGG3_0216990 [Trichomonas vaginalis G3]EAY06592.1 hypothetical protein TVAG_055860 [Trichomonas vaginalis G3]KAI5551630.1 hypothetical protein TVAGG3_0216990 [Trichomonas vaginalis G3]|eukprot:XP_001318815.1 hypothetical protein [Trichomonas vaginalis G3]